MALVGLTVVKDFMGLSQADTTYDLQLTFLNEAVASDIQSALNRTLTLATYLQYFDIPDPYRDTLLLPQWPILAVAGLTNDGVGVPASQYHLYDQYGYLKLRDVATFYNRWGERTNYFTEGKQTVQCQWYAGYTVIPTDVQLLACSAVVRWFNTAEKSGIKSEAIEQYRVEFVDVAHGFTEMELRILNHYKRNVTFLG